MSGVPDSKTGTFIKSELLCASSFINDIIARWEKSCGKLTGADAELVGIIRGKQVEWEEAASKYEIPPSNESPNTNPSSTRSDVLVGPRYAASETQTNGSLSIEGPMYAALMGQTGARASGPGEGAMFRQTQELAGIPNFDSVHAQEVARSEPGVNAQGNGDHVISRGELEVAGRSTGMAAAAEKHSRAPGAVSEERPQKRGARSVDLDSVDLDGERPASAPSFSEPGGSPSEAAENTAEAVGQKERRKQRLERKRKKESEGDGLPGPLAGFGVQHGEGEQASAGQEAGAEMSHRNGGSMPQSLSGDIDLEPASGQNGEWLEGQEPKTDEAHVTGVAYDAFLEEITAPSRPLSADFPALGAGIRVPAAGGPLKRFTNLRRPESGDDVMGSKSSWAKHISSRAAESEGIAAPSDVRMAQADAVTEEYLRKRAAFEEEDRRKRRKMRTKDDFECFERMKGGKMVNSVQGLVLHEQFLDEEEQAAAVSMIRELEQLGADGGLRGRTYTAPRKWMRGKGRVTIQFGCCYNYAVDKMGRPPGILQDEAVEPMPTFLEDILDRMVRWKVMPGGKRRPNSAIINLYSAGDCIPIHIDHHDFDRPFCTMSLLSVAPIKFGAVMESLDAGQFSGAFELPLPKGSVCILNGNAADVAKHCIPSVPEPRISVTFRRMKPEKAPYTSIVLPLPDAPVFHRRAFSPSLIPPSLGPPSLLPEAPRFEAPRAPPIDVSSEAWPDLLGKTVGGPVEKDVGRASGGQPWAPRPPTRPRSGGGPVGGEYGRGSGSGSVVPSLARPSSGGGGPAEWPDLGTSVRGKTSKQSLSAERDGRTNEVVHSELLPPRPSSRSEPREALPPRPSNQPGADDQAHERKSSPVPKSAHFESDEARIRQDDGPFGRSEMRSVSPFRTPGEVRNPSQPSSPERHPSKALDASKSNHSNAVETRGNQVKSMETEKPDPGSVALPDAGPDQEDASNADPDADRNQISDQTPAVHAPSELNPETNRSDKPNANGRVPQNPAQTAELDLGVLKPTGHENVQNGSKASNGFSDGSGESCGDRSGQTSETQKSGLKEERSVPLEFLARKGSDGNGHGQRRSREASPVTSNPERIQGLQWREDRSRMQANETAYPRPYAQSSATSYDRRGKNGERSAVREMGRGQSDERSGISYGGRGQNGWRPDIRGRSVERRFSPEPRQGQNGWGGGNGYERQGSGQNRYSSPGQNDWKQRPSSDPQVSPGGLVSAADEYRRGAYEHGAAYNPPPGAYGGNPEGPGSEGYQKNGTPSKSNLEAAAPAFVPRPLMRSNSGPGGRSHQPVPSASGSGAYRNQPRQDFGQNGSGSGAYSHQPGRDAGSGNGAPPGWDAGRGGSGNGAYSHYSGEHAGQGGLGNGASSHQPGWDAGQHNGGYGAYSNQPGQSNGGGSGVSEAWNYERENGSKVSGQAASNDDEKQPERIPSVDVAWFFDSASTPKSASAGGKQISDGSGEASTGAVSPQQSLAMFFPKETPKKGATD